MSRQKKKTVCLPIGHVWATQELFMRVLSDLSPLWVKLGSVQEKQNYVVTVREIPRSWLKRHFVLLTLQTSFSLGTTLCWFVEQHVQESGYFSNVTWKDTHEARVDSDDSEECGPWEPSPPPPPPDPGWDLTVCSLSPVPLQTHSHVHAQKQACIQTHTRQTPSDCFTGQSRARACFDAKLSGNSVFPSSSFLFYFFST